MFLRGIERRHSKLWLKKRKKGPCEREMAEHGINWMEYMQIEKAMPKEWLEIMGQTMNRSKKIKPTKY